MNTLGNLLLPTASQYHNYEELPFMKDQAAPHLASPFVCGFTVILLFGGLGVYCILYRSYKDISITVCTNCYTTLTAQRLGTESLLNPKDVLLEGNCFWPKHVAVRLNYVQTYVCVVVVCVLGSSIRHVVVWLCFTRLGGPQTRSGRFGKEGIFANDRSRIPNNQYYTD